MLRKASLLFAAGAFGALLNVIALWIAQNIGLPVPPPSLGLLYKQIAWGGLWGFAFFIPIYRDRWWLRGFLIGLLPAALVLLYFLPQQGAGMFGLNISPLVPVIVIFMNSVAWGMAAAFWEKLIGATAES